jgi:hypothetical protein
VSKFNEDRRNNSGACKHRSKSAYPELRLFNINDKILIETDGKDALRAAMVTRFNQQNHARSQIKKTLTFSDNVAVIEETFTSNSKRS